ncbi:hypothetical protein ASD04_16250 [Devosia sp. Root436]|uniref:family 10 glycosylhydrolase n=1 Tax=Devosia sp. Root436 TaxID=1736537 RepID=UPI0006FEF7A8|nr:family 10 glycosylhydrolase [Devosia sp. Root436]KQX34929.1 hypothetical protein ASD04_16250 [Devosia sp. Root436]
MLKLEDRPAAELRTQDWYKTATRWTQLTFVEDDPQRYDPAFWVDVFKRTRSNALCLSAGGYIAYYPSEIPLHYVSKYLGDTDPFGTLVEEARKLDMHVMARVDPHAIHADAAKAHPEWVSLTKDRKPREHWALPGIYVTCAYSSYNFDFMTQVIVEIAEKYDIDALFGNRWQGHGVCYCKACEGNFRSASGYELPEGSNADDPVWQAWAAWRRTVLTRLVAHWDDAVKAVRPHASFIPNMSGSSLMEFDLSVIQKHCPILFVDHQGRRNVELGWSAGRNGKRIRATFRDRPVGLITSIGPEEEPRWKDSVQTGPEIEQWVHAGITQGLFPWFTKFNACIPDDRWVEPVVDSFSLHADLEPVLGTMQPTAEIAVIDPATTLRHWAPEKRHLAELNDLGVYQALVEARLPFEFLSDQVMTAEALGRFKLVILANATYLSDAQCQAIRDYVAAGGSVVAAHETSLYDEKGAARADFGLADVFGVTMTSPPRSGVRNSYVALNGLHPINEGFGTAQRIIGGTKLIAVEATGDVDLPFLTVPDFPDLPMEEVYPRLPPQGAGVVARTTAAGGRVVYVPWNIGEVFWTYLAPDQGRLIANAVKWALGKAPQIEIEGRGVFDVALHEGEEGRALCLLNLTNPMMMKGPLRETWPVGPLKVTIEVPGGRQVGKARLLVAGRDVPFELVDGRAVVDVPGLETMEVVQLSWT